MPTDTITAGETDRMRLIDAALRKRSRIGLRDYLDKAWQDGRGDSWDDIALDLRVRLKGTPYEKISREMVSQYARRYGVAAPRTPGQARTRRRRTAQ